MDISSTNIKHFVRKTEVENKHCILNFKQMHDKT